MFRLERSIEFDAAHRVMGHEGKCAHLHGHRYKVVFVLESMSLDSIGRIVDFGYLKEKWGAKIDQTMDHGVILNTDDPLGPKLLATDPSMKLLQISSPATAEGIAIYLWETFCLDVPDEIRLAEVRVWETPSCMGAFIAR
jgi:6-pyruvoyltetrahydropterin/6-carboxytetrahydropterin synthase